MEAALAAGIHQINVESVPELHLLSAVATKLGRTAPIALRVNPDVDALTHAKIATGKKENKFGIDLGEAAAAYRRAAPLPGIAPLGLAVHIGSQLGGLEPFREAFTRLARLVPALRASGLGRSPVSISAAASASAIATRQPPEVADYAKMVREIFAPLDLALAFEPGRVLAGPAGVLVTRVIYVKEGLAKRFVIVDAAMNDLIRPALYDAWHDIVPVRLPPPGAALSAADVVGPVARPATPLPSTARCRLWPRAISSP